MKLRPVGLVVRLVVLALACIVSVRGAGPLPPLGYFLEPIRGVWGALAYARLPRTATLAIPSLSAPVEVRYDARGVPHIFATTEDDAVRALGYVVARDRLFQLEIQAYAGAGRLTEMVGRAALAADAETRRLGLPRAAARLLTALPDTSRGLRLLNAYADGVNAWIDHLGRAEWPVEFKLLGIKPYHWEPVNSLNLYARMGYTLAFTDGERQRLAAEAMVGRAAAEALFPPHSPIQEPIQPTGAGAPRDDFAPLPPPGAPATALAALLPLLPAPERGDEAGASPLFASNNWAVAPTRSRSGHALLAGDPHLELTLPSIWYEAHLVVPGRLDTYGVTIPGSPGVIIGFNRDLAWSFTNTGADVLDFYRETVDDIAHPAQYLLDGTWRSLDRREERYRGKLGETLRIDTVRFTHRGPLSRLGSDWVSMRWTVNEPNDIAAGLFDAAHATTARDFLDAAARNYYVPAQNMIVADRQGNIGIRSTGHFPIRPDNGDGLVVRDGSTSASDWQGFWPVDQYPQSLNPAQGFLASANQDPIDPLQHPRYLGYDSGYEPWRALQINRLLRANPSVTLDDMRRWQTDPGSVRADLFVPYFTRAVATLRARGSTTPSLEVGDSLLRRWDRRYTRDNTVAILFETAMSQLVRRTWDELVPPGDSLRAATPSGAVLLELLADSTSSWWDDRHTPGTVEDRDAILGASLAGAYDLLAKRYGPPSRNGWRWGMVAPARINHLLRLAGFSELDVPVQ
jgi:penicillin G amidase